MFHALALVAISGHPRLSQKRFAAGALAVGSALFSGSIYLLVLLRKKELGKYLGPVTPFGGMGLQSVTYCRSYYACWMGCIDILNWIGQEVLEDKWMDSRPAIGIDGTRINFYI